MFVSEEAELFASRIRSWCLKTFTLIIKTATLLPVKLQVSGAASRVRL